MNIQYLSLGYFTIIAKIAQPHTSILNEQMEPSQKRIHT